MKRELEILRWFVAGVIILLNLLLIWMIRTRRSQSNGRTDSTSGTAVETISVQSSPTESPVMSPRCEAVNSCVRVSNAGPSPSAQIVKYRRHVNVTPTVPQEDLFPCFHRSHQLLPGSNAVSVYLTCLDCRHHAKWTHRTGPTFQQFLELQQMVQAWWTKFAKTSRMMCWYLLMVGTTSCLDRATNSSFVDTFHVDPWNSRGDLEQRVQRRVRRNRFELVQVGGQVTNPEDRHTAVRLRGYKTRHVQQHRLATVSDRARWRAKLEECWRPITLELVVQSKKSQSLLAYVADLARDQHRRGGRVFLTFPWKWNVLTTWPIQSVISEAPLLFAREKKRGILTNCVDTARLIGRSRCCKSLMSQRLVQSSLANMFVSHEVYLWNVSIQEDSVYSCYPLDDEEATAFPSEEDEAMREWRQEFLEQTRRAIIRIHTNLGHPQNSTLAKMISDAGGSEEMIKCATRYPCSVCKRMSRPRLRRPVSVPRTRQFNDTLLADVHFWNYQGREVLVYSLIDEATRFHVTQIVPSQSARDLYEAIMNAWVKWAGAPRFLLIDPHRSHLARQFIEQLGAQGTTVLVGAAEASWTRGLVERHGAYVRSMVEKMVHDGVPDDMSAQSLFDKATSAKNMMSRIRGYSPSQWVLATQPRIPESLMIDDEDEDHVPHKDIPESQDDEFARSVRVRDAFRRAFIAVDTDQRLRRAAI